jgi:O-antigen ligase
VTSDVHLAWRVLNTPLQVAFEQGALGVLAWLAFGVAALAAVVRSVGSPGATAAFAAAVAGFLAVGLFDSLLDSPRMIVLLALVAAAGAQLGQRSQFRASLEVRLAEHAERPRA